MRKFIYLFILEFIFLVPILSANADNIGSKNISSIDNKVNNIKKNKVDNFTEFKKNFISNNGQPIDKINKITHTEAIGYSMFFAVSYNDKNTFYQVDKWLQNNIKKNEYGLYPWKYKVSNFKNSKISDSKILDKNNATDGDMWIAYAKLTAYEKYNDVNQLNEAKKLIQAIKVNCIKNVNNNLFLLPGVDGFYNENNITINPSYYIPFIFEKFYQYDNDEIWNKLIESSFIMFNDTKYTNLQVHPDFITYDIKNKKYILTNNTYYSYDAIRVPLFLFIYSNTLENSKNILNNYISISNNINDKYHFDKVNLLTNKIEMNPINFGFHSVYLFINKNISNEKKEWYINKIKEGKKNEQQNYYAFSLLCFTDIFK